VPVRRYLVALASHFVVVGFLSYFASVKRSFVTYSTNSLQRMIQR
jgi:hypothetical protein